ncbi:class I adenylate-forming enzyme family protein [Streptomyces fuscichromogenes]|uniref:class I adenylate-forming enzyme family protein n=1 Tax=Streptomyces fuscichromogenes TaxID=1324013 RepID=UPI0037F62332
MAPDLELTQSIRRTAGLVPAGIATVDGDRVTTHAEFVDRVARAAGGLRSLGVGPGDRVSALALNSASFLEHYMACWWLGAVPAPLNIRWSDAEIAAALDMVGSRVLLVDAAFAERGETACSAVPSIEHVVRLDDPPGTGTLTWQALVTDGERLQDGGHGGDDAAILLFTGGTTGRPKAVELSHRNLVVAGIGMRAMGCATGARVLHCPPLFHMGGIQMSVAHWLGGGTHVMMPGFDPVGVARAVQEHRVTDLLLAPTMIEMFLRQPDLGSYDLGSLVQIVYGTSPMTPSLLERAMEVIPDARFVQGYGMTETAMTVMLGAEHHRPEQRESGRMASIGVPSPLAEVRIVDAEGADCPCGTPGELLVRGPSVMKGYWNDPEQTAHVLDGDGWLHTGDGARLDEEGFVYLTDRIKDMIITGGENVYSVEVEKVLTRHPAIASVAVVGVPHPVWGEAVHAVVVPAEGTALTGEELIAFAREHLASFKVPRTVEFVARLPLSAAGKVLKNVVRERARRSSSAAPASV